MKTVGRILLYILGLAALGAASLYALLEGLNNFGG